ncbi:putative Fasciclin-2, partial [Operophtera brumata]
LDETSVWNPVVLADILEESCQHLNRIYVSLVTNTTALKKTSKIADSVLYRDNRDLRGGGEEPGPASERYRLVTSDSEGLDKLQIVALLCTLFYSSRIQNVETRSYTTKFSTYLQHSAVNIGGKPQASLSWWSDQRLLKDTSSALSEHRVRSDLMYGPLREEDHGRVITCFANNNDRTAPLSIDVVVDMFCESINVV